jgi:glycosyltransferase involved in cell wall biosynthesis
MGAYGNFRATVVVPTHDHGATLRYSVGSALRQTVGEIEVFIVGDGMPDQAREVAVELERGDERVRLFDNPTGERFGELHRHAALAEVRAPVVLYLSDDDLWFPEHVETMLATLESSGADFVHASPIWRMGDGTHYRWIADLAQEPYRRLIFEGKNRVGLSSAGHTLDAYRRLPHGWRPAPRDHYSDAWMWRQFAEQPEMKFVCTTAPTVLHLPSSVRPGWTADERMSELASAAEVLGDPERRLALLTELYEAELGRLTWLETRGWELEAWVHDREQAIRWHAERAERAEATIQAMRASRRWQAGERLRRLFSRP